MNCYILILSICYEAGRIFASSDCQPGESTDASQCRHVVYSSLKTKTGAQECCSGPVTALAPKKDWVKDFEGLARYYNKVAYMTSFTTISGQLYIDEDIIHENIQWRNGTRPTGDVSCIAIEPNSTGVIYYPVDCTTALPFFCISVIEQSCDSCNANEECFPIFSTWCSIDCRPIPTSAPVTSVTRTQSTTDLATTHEASTAVTDVATVTLSTAKPVISTTGESTITSPAIDLDTTTKPPEPPWGAIFGGIGGFIVILVIIGLSIRWRKYRRNKERKSTETNASNSLAESWDESEGCSLPINVICRGESTTSRRRLSTLNTPPKNPAIHRDQGPKD